MNLLIERAKTITEHLKIHNKPEFDSIKDLTAYMQTQYSWGTRPIMNAISYAIKAKWLKKGKRKSFGGPTMILLASENTSTIKEELENTTCNLKKAKGTKSEKQIERRLNFAEITQLLIEKIEEVLAEQDAKIADQQKEIVVLGECINSLQLNEEKINQMGEKVNLIENEISQGTEKLLQVLNTLKGKN